MQLCHKRAISDIERHASCIHNQLFFSQPNVAENFITATTAAVCEFKQKYLYMSNDILTTSVFKYFTLWSIFIIIVVKCWKILNYLSPKVERACCDHETKFISVVRVANLRAPHQQNMIKTYRKTIITTTACGLRWCTITCPFLDKRRCKKKQQHENEEHR